MTVTTTEGWARKFGPSSYTRLVAAEVRAQMGRRGISQTMLAAEMGVTQMYVSRRVRKENPTPIDVEDLAAFARILSCDVSDLLPRLDSNQQPSGYRDGETFADAVHPDGLLADVKPAA